jgi:hypothetical protein
VNSRVRTASKATLKQWSYWEREDSLTAFRSVLHSRVRLYTDVTGHQRRFPSLQLELLGWVNPFEMLHCFSISLKLSELNVTLILGTHQKLFYLIKGRATKVLLCWLGSLGLRVSEVRPGGLSIAASTGASRDSVTQCVPDRRATVMPTVVAVIWAINPGSAAGSQL